MAFSVRRAASVHVLDSLPREDASKSGPLGASPPRMSWATWSMIGLMVRTIALPET